MSHGERIRASLTRIAADRHGIFTEVDASACAGAGTLADLTLGIKANIAVRGLPFTAGLGAYRERIAKEDAFVVARLRAAGAAILGMLNMEEAALGATNNNPHFGRTENPLHAGLTPGGSSGGSAAAVAAGLVDVALGTDTMGSCRIPAAYCGVVGFKPSYGRVSLRGVEPLSSRLDHVGVLAHRVASIRKVMDVIGEFDRECEYSRAFPPLAPAQAIPVSGLRFAILNDAALAGVEPTVVSAYRASLEAFRAAGAHCEPRDFNVADLSAARRAGLLLCEAALAVTLAEPLALGGDGISPHLRALIAFGAGKSAPDLSRALNRVDAARLLERRLLQGVDGLLWPTAPQVAFSFDASAPANQADFTCLANFTGAPAISLPLAAPGGLAAGLQLMLPHGADARLIDIAAAVESLLTNPLQNTPKKEDT